MYVGFNGSIIVFQCPASRQTRLSRRTARSTRHRASAAANVTSRASYAKSSLVIKFPGNVTMCDFVRVRKFSHGRVCGQNFVYKI